MKSKERTYVLFVAEKIYLEILKIKKSNPNFTNINAVEGFIGTKFYNEISSGKFHDKWLKNLKLNLKGEFKQRQLLQKRLSLSQRGGGVGRGNHGGAWR